MMAQMVLFGLVRDRAFRVTTVANDALARRILGPMAFVSPKIFDEIYRQYIERPAKVVGLK